MTKEERNQRQKERYEWLKSHKICTICGREKAVIGQTLCESCRKKSHDRVNSFRKNATPENRLKRLAYAREYAKRKRAEYSAKGLCIACGKRPPKNSRKTCEVCLTRQRKYYRKQHETAKKEKNYEP